MLPMIGPAVDAEMRYRRETLTRSYRAAGGRTRPGPRAWRWAAHHPPRPAAGATGRSAD